MTKPLRFPIEPRMIPPEKVARRLGVSPVVFTEKRAQLEAAGFPKPDAVLGNYCLQAVDRWIDAQAGLTDNDNSVSAQSAMLQAVRSKAWAR